MLQILFFFVSSLYLFVCTALVSPPHVWTQGKPVSTDIKWPILQMTPKSWTILYKHWVIFMIPKHTFSENKCTEFKYSLSSFTILVVNIHEFIFIFLIFFPSTYSSKILWQSILSGYCLLSMSGFINSFSISNFFVKQLKDLRKQSLK